MAISRRKTRNSPPDWKAIDNEIIARLDIRAEYLAMGIEPAGKERADGIVECFAIDRSDRSPSAYFNVHTGRYGDSGSSEEQLVRTISFFDFAVRFGKLGFETFVDARVHFGAKCGIEVPKTPKTKKYKSSYVNPNAPSSSSASSSPHTAGHKSPPTSEQQNTLSPSERIKIVPWSPGDELDMLSWQVDHWAEAIKPGTSTAAVLACGGVIADWPVYRDTKNQLRLAHTKTVVIALPVYTGDDIERVASASIAPGESPTLTAPSAYTIYPLSQTHLSIYQGKDERTKETLPPRLEKKLTIGPARGSLLPAIAIQAIQQQHSESINNTGNPIPKTIKRIWKTAGETDLLALIRTFPQANWDARTDLALTNASGEGSDVLPQQVHLLSKVGPDCPILIIHDADETGEIGALKWCIALATANVPCKQVRLPYEITKDHGKDLRDWLIENNFDYQKLCDLADSQPLFVATPEQLADGLREQKRLIEHATKIRGTETSAAPAATALATLLSATPAIAPSATTQTSTTPQAQAISVLPATPHADPYRGKDKPLWIGRVVDEDTGRSYELANYFYQTVDGLFKSGKKDTTPQMFAKTTRQCIEDIHYRTGGWPKVIGLELFIDDCVVNPDKYKPSPTQHTVIRLRDGNQLLAWCKMQFGETDWRGASDCVNRQELFDGFISTADRFQSIEYSPHEPPMTGNFYACHMPDPPPLPPANPESDSTLGPLDTLVSFFSPGTADVDDALIKTFILSLFWGEEQEAKPGFAITSSSQGQGSGKTTLVELISSLTKPPTAKSGLLDFQMGGNIETFMQRILGDRNSGIRVIRIDNLKSHGLSWGDLEALMTTEVITGKKMYVGEVDRKNDFIWALTVNGIALSRDMAERVVTIEIAPPSSRDPGWRFRVKKFITENRDAIIEDIVAHLRRKPGVHTAAIQPKLRWSAWEVQMLQHFANPDEIQEAITKRLTESDTGADEVEFIEERIVHWLKEFMYNPKLGEDKVFIKSRVLGEIACEALGLPPKEARHQSRRIEQLIKEGKLKQLFPRPGRDMGRGYVWNGPGNASKESVNDKFSAAYDDRNKHRKK